ncbi:receptor expression-enhancing protein 1-like, partial [Leptonychotes weddellii]|uniref:Receptor expression-enhancing protein n=1 Tax=Leptonychotes weddellii TaxID=9713 RepID=A0A7F8Q8J4_LEPWE
MVSWIISRLVVLIFGTLYPAYYSYKAVKSKDIKEYVSSTDWFPFYYELKIAFVAWLLSPYTKGSSLLYRKFVHPTLSSKEKVIYAAQPFTPSSNDKYMPTNGIPAILVIIS